LQSAARDRGERSDFADHRRDAGSAQAFLHRPQDLAVARRLNQHDARRVEPVRGEAGPVEVRAGETPQYDAVLRRALPGRKPSEDAGGKGGGERAVLFIAAYPEDLVQGPSGEPAARQYPIDRSNAERQDPMDHHRRPLDPPEALAQLRKAGFLLDHVLFLFWYLFLSMASRACRVMRYAEAAFGDFVLTADWRAGLAPREVPFLPG
jgi:hypothetical protein